MSDGHSDPQISFEGRWVRLRLLQEADYDAIFRWWINGYEASPWAPSRRPPTAEEFIEEVAHFVRQSIMLIVEPQPGGEPIGFVRAKNLNLSDGLCSVHGHVENAHWGGDSAEAYFGAVDYLFLNFPIRKVLLDVYEFERDCVSFTDQRYVPVRESLTRAHVV